MKYKSIAFIMSFLYFLTGCTTRHLSIEQSKKNFNAYYNSVNSIAAEYRYAITEEKDENIENQDTYKDIKIVINQNEEIHIRITNSAYNSDKGVESFVIDYFLINQKSSNQFNIPLFVKLVNSISGKEISSEFCEEFLSAPESEYAATDYGYNKQAHEMIVKQHFFNFWEDWTIFYVSENTGVEKLSFGGLTKQLR